MNLSGLCLALSAILVGAAAQQATTNYWSWNDWWDNWYNRYYASSTTKTQIVTLPTTTKTPETPSCKNTCFSITDCSAGLSCFGATAASAGCCLAALKPNQTGCQIDDQCRRACESSHCDKSQSPARCLCDKGRHFLFKKCWKTCPAFAYEEPVVYEDGYSVCVLRTDEQTAMNYMRRHKRQLRSARIFC